MISPFWIYSFSCAAEILVSCDVADILVRFYGDCSYILSIACISASSLGWYENINRDFCLLDYRFIINLHGNIKFLTGLIALAAVLI